jgi:ABC-type transport system involved in cytochrome c biogenesis permease subunit
VCYLIQERRLKSKKGGRLLEKLPPLATLDNLISGSLGVAFVLITIGMVLVITWEFMYEGSNSWIGNPRVMVSLVTWALLLATTYLRATAGWRGRKAAVMSLVVLGCSAVTWAAHRGFMSR